MEVDIQKFYDFVKDQLNKQKKSQYVYFHNLSFDGSFLLYFLHSIGADYEAVINQSKKIYEVKVRPTKSKYFIAFRCSYLIFLTSVASLPYSTKSTIDYSTIRNYKTLDEATEEEKYYIIQDVITVKKNLINLVELHNIKLTGFFKTIGSISYKELKKTTEKNLYKKNLWWNLVFPPLEMEMDEYIRKAYFGGYTYVNPNFQGKLITDLMGSWDIVSDFPDKMRNKELPVGYPKITIHKPNKGKLYIVRLRVLEANIKKGLHPFISTSRAMRYTTEIYSNHLEEEVLTLTNLDYEMFEEYYTGIWEVIDYCVFPKTIKGAFNEYIDKYFGMKDDNKHIVNKYIDIRETRDLTDKEQSILKEAQFNKMWAKLKINSPYGKTGTNPTLISLTPKFNEKGLMEFTETIEEKEVNPYYLPLAVFITAYARKQLIPSIQLNADRFVYCDTDSEHLIGLDTPKGMTIGSELGQWEYEGTSFKSKFMKPKQYLKLKEEKGELVIKRTIASMSKSEHHRVNFDNFYIGSTIKGGKRGARNVLGGRLIRELDFTFK